MAAREPKLASASNPQAQIPAQVAWQCCHVISMLHTGELPGHGGLAALPCCCWPLVLFQAANLQTVLLQQGLSTALKIGMAAPEGPREGATGERRLEHSWRRWCHEPKVSCGTAASSMHPGASAWGELRAAPRSPFWASEGEKIQKPLYHISGKFLTFILKFPTLCWIF